MGHVRNVAAYFFVFFAYIVTADAGYTTSVRGQVKLPAYMSTENMVVTLDEGVFSAFVREDGSFELHNVPAGKYALDVEDAHFSFAKYKIQVSFKGNEDGTVHAIKYQFPGASKEKVNYPLLIEPTGQTNYFEIRQGYNVWSILRSPTIMMMLPMLGLFLCMKFLVDPEELKRMQQEQQEEAAKKQKKA